MVDASVVLAGLFKDGTVRDVLLNSDDITFIAPFFLREEIGKHVPRVVSKTGLPRATVEAALQDMLEAIDLVPSGLYAVAIAEAGRKAALAGAVGDADYIALSLAFGAPILSLDRDFRRIPGLEILATSQVDSS